MTFFLDEVGGQITDSRAATVRLGMDEVAQQYGRYYVLLLVRWLSDLFYELVRLGAHDHRIKILFGHDEFFSTFRVPDEYLKTRKKWPLR